jgi:tetratricopeptide (TPR) repeat protein
MLNLALYYEQVEKNDDQMLHYSTLAIDLHNSADAMFNLGVHYEKLKDYDNMKKYYLMAIDVGDNEAFNSLLKYIKNPLKVFRFRVPKRKLCDIKLKLPKKKKQKQNTPPNIGPIIDETKQIDA